MSSHDKWATTAPRFIYDNYPDQDLLPIEPPKPGETISAFSQRAEDAGDTLFLFLCREANDEIDAEEYLKRLDRAMRDIAAVHDAVLADAASYAGPDAGKAPRTPSHP